MTGPAYDLDDGELVRAVKIILDRKPEALNDWEREFAAGIDRSYVRSGGLSWKQRKAARIMVDRVMLTLAKLHGREDLAAKPAPAPKAPPKLVVVPPPPPPDFPKIIAKLSPAQLRAIRECSDGVWHKTSTGTRDGIIDGRTAKALAYHHPSIMERKGWADGRGECRLTEFGREVAVRLPDEEPKTAVPSGVW
jgi:hypothetical protein